MESGGDSYFGNFKIRAAHVCESAGVVRRGGWAWFNQRWSEVCDGDCSVMDRRLSMVPSSDPD
jgi:hypothetical protein